MSYICKGVEVREDVRCTHSYTISTEFFNMQHNVAQMTLHFLHFTNPNVLHMNSFLERKTFLAAFKHRIKDSVVYIICCLLCYTPILGFLPTKDLLLRCCFIFLREKSLTYTNTPVK